MKTVFAIIAAIIAVLVGLALWQYNTIAPTTVTGGETAWYIGFVHGLFSVPNLLLSAVSDDNKTIFQAGGDGWYAFWWLVGAGVIFGGGSSARH